MIDVVRQSGQVFVHVAPIETRLAASAAMALSRARKDDVATAELAQAVGTVDILALDAHRGREWFRWASRLLEGAGSIRDASLCTLTAARLSFVLLDAKTSLSELEGAREALRSGGGSRLELAVFAAGVAVTGLHAPGADESWARAQQLLSEALELLEPPGSDLVNPSTDKSVEAFPLTGFDGDAFGGVVRPVAYHDETVYMETETPGYLFTAKLSSDPSGLVTQGNAVDLRKVQWKADQLGTGAVLEKGGKKHLVVIMGNQNPSKVLGIVDLGGLSAGDVVETAATFYTKEDAPEWDKVTLSSVEAKDDIVFLGESAYVSKAAQNAGNKHRLWAARLGADGKLDASSLTVYSGEVAEFDEGECPDGLPRGGQIWVGDYNGATHVFMGHFRTLAIWKFPGGPDSGERVLMGSGAFKSDLELDEYAMGLAGFATTPDNKMIVYGDCNSEYLYLPFPEPSNVTMTRQRMAVLDLSAPDTSGVPTKYLEYSDTKNIPDAVTQGSDSLHEVLSEEYVAGLEFDSHSLLLDILKVFGKDAIGVLPSAATQARIIRMTVATENHLYVIGAGSVAYGNTGLTNSSEVMIQDLKSGTEVLHSEYQWFYDGSSYSDPWYGYRGMQIGDVNDKNFSTGIYLIKK